MPPAEIKNTSIMQKTIKMILVLYLFAFLHLSVDSKIATTTIDSAQVIGREVALNEVKINEYLGIPYAQPPIGDLRFKPTTLFPPYTGQIMAKRQPPACPQYTTNPYPWYYNGTHKSEDCLYLNIWSPASAGRSDKKAVFFWIHGGGYRTGAIRQSPYNGTALAALGDVVVVTVSYRMGAFGFMYSATEDAPGNAGLWDTALALQWVNKYIASFGGDASRITIAGESVGSLSVGLLNLSPITKNLFQRMIMESEAPLVGVTDGTHSLDLAQMIAEFSGCGNESYTFENHKEDVMKCLRDLTFEELSVADSKININFPASFFPIYGDPFIPEDPIVSSKRDDLDCKELLIGVNDNEGCNLITSSYPDVFGFFGEKDPKISRSQAETFVKNTYSLLAPNKAEEAVSFYLPDDLEDDGYTYRNQTCDAMGDMFFVCGTEEFARLCSRNSKVYFYHFNYRCSMTPWAEWEGATHFSEVELVFGRPILFPQEYNQDDITMSRRLIKIWTDFTKHGSPGDYWPLFTENNEIAVNLAIGDAAQDKELPHLENCKFVGKAFNFM